MRIAKLKVANYGAVPDLDIAVREHLVLVGPNEAGKTSLLRLLDAVLGGSVGSLYGLIEPDTLRSRTEPMLVEVEFGDFTDDDKAALPDQIEVLDDGSLRLRILLRATYDTTTDSVAIERLFIKPGLQLAVSATDLGRIGWAFLPAGRSPDRELGVGRASAVRNLLGAVDLGEALATIVNAIATLHETVHDAPALVGLRQGLAAALSELLPHEVTADDLALALPNANDTDPLADVDVKYKGGGGSSRSLRDQSDGVRALSTVAIQLLAKRASNIVAVDEPEIHLHPRAQARLAALLRDKAAQSVLATHSPAVLTQFSPMHALSLIGDRCRQLPSEPFSGDPKSAAHWWTTPALEPLTSRGVILVEGVADRVIVESIASGLGIDLDRLGVVVASVNGAGGFKMACRLFGPNGFDVPMVGVVDAKEASDVAGYLSIQLADLGAAGFIVCDPDLEGECVKGLGATDHARLLCASGIFTEARVCSSNSVAVLEDLVDGTYADWCRRNKTEAAVALAAMLGSAEAATITPLADAVALMASKLT